MPGNVLGCDRADQHRHHGEQKRHPNRVVLPCCPLSAGRCSLPLEDGGDSPLRSQATSGEKQLEAMNVCHKRLEAMSTCHKVPERQGSSNKSGLAKGREGDSCYLNNGVVR